MAGKRVKEFRAFDHKAAKALTKLQAATRLVDLRHPPLNRFEAPGGRPHRAVQHPDQRPMAVCLRWAAGGGIPAGADVLVLPGEAYDVEITDFH
ncbi:type II toxin-antitoxin system RelE/ParE family toxin [Azospirillum halopraeferens]|uniref:type II toxin-antitoxin system RelE/ParE family toxin n=1 Tax=Azospirillum halopraeferens TaxID=34010 RepID=UPI001B3B7057|nr:type II toxin-antitoxin system RelE/ParE family toxin [Azospirillum halopraeferens]